MKKELLLPFSWQHKVCESELVAFPHPLKIDMLWFEKNEVCPMDIAIIIMPYNQLSFSVKINDEWHHFIGLDDLVYFGFDIVTLEAIFYGLFTFWHCLSPLKACAIIEYHQWYQDILSQADRESESEFYYDKMLYVTKNLYKRVKQLMQKEMPDWTVVLKPIIYRPKPYRDSLAFSDSKD